MKSIQIFEQILMQSDEDILRTLPTEDRLACCSCNSIAVSRRVSGKYHCPNCDAEKDVVTIVWYYKNQTSDPGVAIERHRKFWKGIYLEQIARESFIKPNFRFLSLLQDFQNSRTSPRSIPERILRSIKRRFLNFFSWSHV